QSFLGMVNFYRKFIPFCSELSKPLQALTGNALFKWDSECTRSFLKLKQALKTPPLLSYQDFKQLFVLRTDASGYALGAVLENGTEENLKPVAYVSRKLTPAEINYS